MFGSPPPPVTVPTGPPPSVLEASDLITGTGRTAQGGDTITVQYVLVDYASGKELQSSWESTSFSFKLGEGQVIKGWDEGVVGMKMGGRRELVVPPNLAYGETPPPGSGIEPNANLVFVIDLLSFGSPAPTATTTTLPSPPPTYHLPPTIQPTTVAHLGEALTLTATSFETGTMKITLDKVIDPDTSPSPRGSGGSTISGDRWVELVFTVTNGGTTLPAFAGYNSERDSLELLFALDPASVTDQYGDPYYTSNVAGNIPIAAGATVTDSSPFEIPIGLKVTTVSASLQWATGSGPGPVVGEWLIP